MEDFLVYHNYCGNVRYSKKENCLCGRVLGIRKKIEYKGRTLEELEYNFSQEIESYLRRCEEEQREPETPYLGTIQIRMKPELHRRAGLYAARNNISLNALISRAIAQFLDREEEGSIGDSRTEGEDCDDLPFN